MAPAKVTKVASIINGSTPKRQGAPAFKRQASRVGVKSKSNVPFANPGAVLTKPSQLQMRPATLPKKRHPEADWAQPMTKKPRRNSVTFEDDDTPSPTEPIRDSPHSPDPSDNESDDSEAEEEEEAEEETEAPEDEEYHTDEAEFGGSDNNDDADDDDDSEEGHRSTSGSKSKSKTRTIHSSEDDEEQSQTSTPKKQHRSSGKKPRTPSGVDSGGPGSTSSKYLFTFKGNTFVGIHLGGQFFAARTIVNNVKNYLCL